MSRLRITRESLEVVGVVALAGFTTFSTYSLDCVNLVRLGQPVQAVSYLFLTAIGAVLAVGLGMLATRRLIARRAS